MSHATLGRPAARPLHFAVALRALASTVVMVTVFCLPLVVWAVMHGTGGTD